MVDRAGADRKVEIADHARGLGRCNGRKRRGAVWEAHEHLRVLHAPVLEIDDGLIGEVEGAILDDALEARDPIDRIGKNHIERGRGHDQRRRAIAARRETLDRVAHDPRGLAAVEPVMARLHGCDGNRRSKRARRNRVDQSHDRGLHLGDIDLSAMEHAISAAAEIAHRLHAGPAQAELPRDRGREPRQHRRRYVPAELHEADRFDEADPQSAGEVLGEPPHRERGEDRTAHQAALGLGDQAEGARALARIVADAQKQDRALLRQAAAAEEHGLGGAATQPDQQRRDRLAFGNARRVLAHRDAISGIEEVAKRQSDGRMGGVGADPVDGAGDEGDRAAVIELDEQVRGREGYGNELVALALVTLRRHHGRAAHLGSTNNCRPHSRMALMSRA